MAKDSKIAVRSHAEERQWLLDLGQGNIVKGVRTLVQYSQGEPSGKNGSSPSQGRKFKK